MKAFNKRFQKYTNVVAVYNQNNRLISKQCYESAEQAYYEYRDLTMTITNIGYTICRYNDGYIMSIYHVREE